MNRHSPYFLAFPSGSWALGRLVAGSVTYQYGRQVLQMKRK